MKLGGGGGGYPKPCDPEVFKEIKVKGTLLGMRSRGLGQVGY